MKLARNVLSGAVVTAGVVALGTVPAQAATDTVQSWACNPGKVCLYIDQEAEQRWEVPPYTQRVLIGYTDNKTTRVFVHC